MIISIFGMMFCSIVKNVGIIYIQIQRLKNIVDIVEEN